MSTIPNQRQRALRLDPRAAGENPADPPSGPEPPTGRELTQPAAGATAAQLLTTIRPRLAPAELSRFLDAFTESAVAQALAGELDNVELDQLCGQLVRNLRAAGYTCPAWTVFRRMITEAIVRFREMAAAENDAAEAASEPQPVRRFIADAPVPDDVVIPRDWTLLDDMGVGNRRQLNLVPTPLVITRRLVHVTDGTELVCLAWKRDGRWIERVVPRADIANTRKIVELAAFGLPVTSNSAREVVRYLAEFEAVNLDHLPRSFVTSQLGWCGDNLQGFLWGHQLLAPTPVPEHPLGGANPPEANALVLVSSVVQFQGADEGDEQLAAGFCAAGSWTTWQAAAEPALAYVRVRLAFLASLCTPLLRILEAPNFVVDWCGATSIGKTTTLRLAASAWGRPDERTAAAALASWNTTRVWIERGAAVLNNLPLILDDTKQARSNEDVAKVLYDLVAGRGRGRGSTRGIEKTRTWATVMLTSGEAPATSFTQDGGTRARVLTLWGPPFEQADQTTAALVQQLNVTLGQHYGHAGPQFVQFLLDHRERWPTWRIRFQRIKEHYLRKAGGNPVVGRLSDALAVLTLTGLLARRALGMPVLARSPVPALWAELAAEAGEADRAAQALHFVLEWAHAHEEEFFGRRPTERGQPAGGWAGHWGPHLGLGGPATWEFLGFLPGRLKTILAAEGFEYEAVVRIWRDRNWLVVDPSDNSRRYHQVRVGNSRWRVVSVRRIASWTDMVVSVQPAPSRPPPLPRLD